MREWLGAAGASGQCAPAALIRRFGRPLNFTVRRWLMNVSIPPLVASRIFWPVKRTVTRLGRGGLCGILPVVSFTALFSGSAGFHSASRRVVASEIC